MELRLSGVIDKRFLTRANSAQERQEDLLASHADYTQKQGFGGLCFPPLLERHYRDARPVSKINRHRLYIFCGLFFVIGLGFVDPWFAGKSLDFAVVMRNAVVAPLLGVQLALSYVAKNFYIKIEHLLTWSILSLAFMGTLYVMVNSGDEYATHYHGTLMVVVLYGNLLTRFQFFNALVWSCSTLIVYLYVWSGLVWADPLNSYYASVMVVMIIISLLTGYQVDYQSRKDYLQDLLLRQEKRKLENMQRHLYQYAIIDSLTGLYNRRHFDDSLSVSWRVAFDRNLPISLLFIDVDCFKRFNDSYGHQEGDDCLKKVANVLSSLDIQPGDVIARYGGEEFVIILQGVENNAALEIAESIRQQIEELDIPHGGSTVSNHVTASVGVATMFPRKGNSSRQIIELADKALYQAKTMGRNCVVNSMQNSSVQNVESFA